MRDSQSLTDDRASNLEDYREIMELGQLTLVSCTGTPGAPIDWRPVDVATIELPAVREEACAAR